MLASPLLPFCFRGYKIRHLNELHAANVLGLSGGGGGVHCAGRGLRAWLAMKTVGLILHFPGWRRAGTGQPDRVWACRCRGAVRCGAARPAGQLHHWAPAHQRPAISWVFLVERVTERGRGVKEGLAFSLSDLSKACNYISRSFMLLWLLDVF